MSDIESKLAAPEKAFGAVAAATLEQLQARPGFRFVDENHVEVHAMGTFSRWVRVSGVGKKARFEKYENSSEGGNNNGTAVRAARDGFHQEEGSDNSGNPESPTPTGGGNGV